MSNTEKVTLEELSDDTTSLSSHNSLSSNTNNNNNNEVIIKTDSGGGGDGGTSKSNSFDHEFMLDHQNYSSTYQPKFNYGKCFYLARLFFIANKISYFNFLRYKRNF